MLAAFLILSFYSEVVAWVFAYVFKAIGGSILSSFGFEPPAGPSLVSITIPAVFSQIPGGQLLMIAFFILASVAATGAMLSLMEVPVVILPERMSMSRPKATLLTIAVPIILGASCALTWAGCGDATTSSARCRIKARCLMPQWRAPYFSCCATCRRC